MLVYFSYILIGVSYYWIFHTRQGLILRGVGEQPISAYSRGIDVNRQRYIYTALGSGLIGLAGPMYSLSIKAGWNGTMTGLDGIGWIVLSITIFGGWNPLRGSFGALLVCIPAMAGVSAAILPGPKYLRRCCKWRLSR